MEVKDYSENYGEGWIKLYRSTKYKGWYKKSDYVHVWVHLLLKANHHMNEWIYKNETLKVNPGQFVTSRKTLSKETGISESKVERILKFFEIEQQIEQQNLFSSRIITISNWKDYQKIEQQIEQPVNSQRTAGEQPVNTNKNVKKEKNDNKKDLYSELFEKVFWKYYPPSNGKKLGKQESFAAMKLHVKVSEFEDFGTALKNYIESDEVKRGFVKHPKRFFKNRDWNWKDWINP